MHQRSDGKYVAILGDLGIARTKFSHPHISSFYGYILDPEFEKQFLDFAKGVDVNTDIKAVSKLLHSVFSLKTTGYIMYIEFEL